MDGWQGGPSRWDLEAPGRQAPGGCLQGQCLTSAEGLCLDLGSDCLVESSSLVILSVVVWSHPACLGTPGRCLSWSCVSHSPSSLVPGRGMVRPS